MSNEKDLQEQADEGVEPALDLAGEELSTRPGTVEVEALDIMEAEPAPGGRPPPLPDLGRVMPQEDREEAIAEVGSTGSSPQGAGAEGSIDAGLEQLGDAVEALSAGMDGDPALTLPTQDAEQEVSGGGAEALPSVAPCYVPAHERVVWHQLDYREAALLAQMDGLKNRDEVILAAELDVAVGLRMLDGLLDRGLIRPAGMDSQDTLDEGRDS